jgi:hypothetical protein
VVEHEGQPARGIEIALAILSRASRRTSPDARFEPAQEVARGTARPVAWIPCSATHSPSSSSDACMSFVPM